jgi:phosphonate degradation associated HDIG domain protein
MTPPLNLSMDIVAQIEELFNLHGHGHYEGARAEPVTARAHALQCAQLAEWADAPPPLVAAALLHDIGHFIAPDGALDAVDDVHELRGLGFLASSFSAAVVEPIRLHVQAKRYLVTTEPAYADSLSAASTHTLRLQGGAMSPDELDLFDALPHSAEAVALRRWDERAKTPGRRTPTLDYFLLLLESVRLRPHEALRTAIGACDLA